VVFFGEPIPWAAMDQAENEACGCGVLLVIGTSAQVTPACNIPRVARQHGAFIIEVNPEETPLTARVTDIHLQGSASETIPRLLEQLRGISG
jgi:NAD-dependent deacetylase